MEEQIQQISDAQIDASIEITARSTMTPVVIKTVKVLIGMNHKRNTAFNHIGMV